MTNTSSVVDHVNDHDTQQKEGGGLSTTETVVAKPDIESLPSENKKLKSFHDESDHLSAKGDQIEGEVEIVDVKDRDGDLNMGTSGESIEKEQQPSLIGDGDITQPSSSSSSTSASTPDPDPTNEAVSPAVHDRINEEVDGDPEDEDQSKVVQAVPLTEELEKQEEWWELKMTWSGKVFEFKVGGNDMVYDFRDKISTLTGVSPEGQKLINLLPGSKGKLSVEHDAKRFGTLGVKKNAKFIMVGTREEDRFKDKSNVGKEVVEDFDVTYSATARGFLPADDPRNKRKIKEIVDRIPITVMNEPREGKRLLVLDLDYTIVDTKPLISGALPSSECARPGLHEFLELVYPHYDIVIWSQTHWRWLESKLVELDMIGGMRNYKVSFVSDRTTMFPVWTMRKGQPYKHEVKPLAYFWSHFPQWSAKNTIHIDDLSRNFACNPGEGLKIRAFKTAGLPEGQADRELSRLGEYLVRIANNVEDFTTLDHTRWKKGPPRS